VQIADNPPDIILITEVIPKAQVNPIDEGRLGFNVFLNFDPTLDLQIVVVLQSMYPTF